MAANALNYALWPRLARNSSAGNSSLHATTNSLARSIVCRFIANTSWVRHQESLHLVEDFGRNGGTFDLPEEPFDVVVAIALFVQLPTKLVE
jgi:hypothetical protein